MTVRCGPSLAAVGRNPYACCARWPLHARPMYKQPELLTPAAGQSRDCHDAGAACLGGTNPSSAYDRPAHRPGGGPAQTPGSRCQSPQTLHDREGTLAPECRRNLQPRQPRVSRPHRRRRVRKAGPGARQWVPRVRPDQSYTRNPWLSSLLPPAASSCRRGRPHRSQRDGRRHGRRHGSRSRQTGPRSGARRARARPHCESV